jgi:hypothetical protein
MSDSQKSVLNLELCGEKLRKARREPLNAKYPPCFKEYREKLFFKRGAAETRIYEVFAPNVFNHEPYEYQRIDPGVYNVENSHWSLLLEKSHVVVSFVWKVGPSKDDTCKLNVTGGNCLVHVDRQIRPPRPDILSDLEDAMDEAESNSASPEAPKTPKPLEIPAGLGRPKAVGITSLSVANIQKVGNFWRKLQGLRVLGNWLCEYTGCHHVLWNYRSEFIQAFLYLILDNPSIQCGLRLLKLETVYHSIMASHLYRPSSTIIQHV